MSNDVRGPIGGFTIRRCYLDVANLMTPKHRRDFILAIIEAGLNDVWPDESSPMHGPIETVRNQILVGRNNWVKAANRLKGEKRNETEDETRNETEDETRNETEDEKRDETGYIHNTNKTIPHKASEIARGRTIEKMRSDAPAVAHKLGAPDGFLAEFLEGMDQCAWVSMNPATGLTWDVTPANLTHTMRNWLNQWHSKQGIKKMAARAAVESSGGVERDPATVIDLEG